MAISSAQKKKILQVLNVFETGKPEGIYDSIVTYVDGPVIDGKRVKQITYGRSQTTEFGNLKRLIEKYIENKGLFAEKLTPYLNRLGKHPSLYTDHTFRALLKRSAKEDIIMRTTQDDFFDVYYYQPALVWFQGHGFKSPLSLLVIYDSFIHSGSIMGFLRKRFAARPPINGGSEQGWITEYTETRHDWLKTHRNPILRKTIYRTTCLLNQIKKGNWDLSQPVEVKDNITL